DERAEQPELRADDGEDVVGVLVRQVPELLPRRAETEAEPATGGQRDQSLAGLVARLLCLRGGARIGEAGEPREPVRLGHREQSEPAAEQQSGRTEDGERRT